MFEIRSPTVEEWLKTYHSARAELENPRMQMESLLEAYQEDIDSQFDEKQGEWQSLAKFTVEKKKKLGADPRILHETKEGQGLRLRDAYRKAGHVDNDGLLTYSYPVEKPYAKEHQQGIADTEKKRPKMDRMLAREMARLDKEYDDMF